MGFVLSGASEQAGAGTHVACRLADEGNSSINVEFIALRVKARGDGPFVL